MPNYVTQHDNKTCYCIFFATLNGVNFYGSVVLWIIMCNVEKP